MTIVEALQNLVTAIGGTYTADDDTVSEVLAKVTAAFESGEFVTDLPAVTSDDNGDLLTVVSGEWAKADPPTELPAVTAGDDGDILTVVDGAWAKADPPAQTDYSPYDVPFTLTQSGQTWTGTTEASFADAFAVAAASPCNRFVRAKCSIGSGFSFLPLGVVDATDGSEMLIFAANVIVETAVVFFAINWTASTVTVTPVPLTT